MGIRILGIKNRALNFSNAHLHDEIHRLVARTDLLHAHLHLRCDIACIVNYMYFCREVGCMYACISVFAIDVPV